MERGNLTPWFDEAFLSKHWRPAPTGRRGPPCRYSEVAIQTRLTLKVLFQLPYRMVAGFGRSLMARVGADLPIPDHTQVSRRAKTLTVRLPRRGATAPRHIAIDAMGIIIYGEGEWQVGMHGASKRRIWRKIHLAVDTHRLEIVAVAVTTADWIDGEVGADLLDQIEGPIKQIDADSAYDNHATYEAAIAPGADLVVPPRASAVPWAADHPRPSGDRRTGPGGVATAHLVPPAGVWREMPGIPSNSCLASGWRHAASTSKSRRSRSASRTRYHDRSRHAGLRAGRGWSAL